MKRVLEQRKNFRHQKKVGQGTNNMIPRVQCAQDLKPNLVALSSPPFIIHHIQILIHTRRNSIKGTNPNQQTNPNRLFRSDPFPG